MVKQIFSALKPLAVTFVSVFALISPLRAEILPALSAQQAKEWSAVGVVNLEGPSGMALCSGTLIAPDLVLTAIHCAPNTTGKRDFVVRGIGHPAQISIPSVKIQHHPAYATATGTAQFKFDIALMTLARPVSVDLAQPLALAATQELPEELAIVAFHRMRPGTLNGRFDCARQPAAEFVLGCQVIAGNSGSPALMQASEGWQIAGVVVARMDSGTTHNALVAPLDAWVRAKVRQHTKATP